MGSVQKPLKPHVDDTTIHIKHTQSDAAPTVNDDVTQGYNYFSTRTQTNVNDDVIIWVCLNPTATAAIWKPIYGEGVDATDFTIHGKVNEAAGINIGQYVYVNGGSGERLTFGLADITNHNKAHAIGMAKASKTNNQDIEIVIIGAVKGSDSDNLDTDSYLAGERIHLSTAGNWVGDTPPTVGAHLHGGRVKKPHVTAGIIEVSVDQFVHAMIAAAGLNLEFGVGSDNEANKISYKNKSGAEFSKITPLAHYIDTMKEYTTDAGVTVEGVLLKDSVVTADNIDQDVSIAASPTLDGSNFSNIGPTNLDDDLHTLVHTWNGSIIETISITATSNGTVVTANLEKDGGGDLTLIFSDEFSTFDCTPTATISLTAGSDTSPQINYVYIPQSTKALTVSTSGFPAAEYAPVATILVQSAASVQSDGVYKLHAWRDHAHDTNNQGHLSHINDWIRRQHASWISGIAQTLTITANGGAPDNVIFTSTSGSVYQLHPHPFPAFSGTPDVYVVNDFTTPYDKVTDLNTLLTDSLGNSMSGKYFSLVLWGSVNEASGDCKLFVNLPGGFYNSSNGVIRDSDKYANFQIPADFIGTGFLISELKLRHQAASSGTWTSIQEVDLRGLRPAIHAGSGVAGAVEFADNIFIIFDEADATKQIAFQASGITTGNTRTVTMADADVDLGDIGTHTAAANPHSGSAASGANSDITSLTGLTTALSTGQGGTGQDSYTDGQLLIGKTDTTITKATLTAGEGIDITNGDGSITILGEDASTTNKGISELTTSAEIDTGTDPARAITPNALDGSKYFGALKDVFNAVIDGGGSAIPTATRANMKMKHAGTITKINIRAEVDGVETNGSISFDVYKNDVKISASDPVDLINQKDQDHSSFIGWDGDDLIFVLGDTYSIIATGTPNVEWCILDFHDTITGA